MSLSSSEQRYFASVDPTWPAPKIKIVDNGNGFPMDILDQVFEPYVTTKSTGSGLGLAIVQNIVEQHDGQIYASNEEPHGARVTIEFSIIASQRS